MDTDRMKKMVERHEQNKGKYTYVVVNHSTIAQIESEFDTIEEAIHKLELDLMSNAHLDQCHDDDFIYVYLKKKGKNKSKRRVKKPDRTAIAKSGKYIYGVDVNGKIENKS